MRPIFTCLVVFFGFAQALLESKDVQIEQGLLRGYKDLQGNFFSFYDVPYARAPIGRDKFKAPLPPEPWTGTFEAVNRNVTCPQYLSLASQEDCLVANIFVPNTNQTNLPVVINVHGGFFLQGAGHAFPLSNLADTQRTIVVTFNYRLGVHGFLCLGTETIPGNAGMKDQVALLRWVNRNIASFGGNPDDVTISGCGAGGASVEYLSISPMSQGLFSKCIVDSGSFKGLFGAQTDPTENAKRYARHLKFTDVDNSTALEEFYTSATLELLLSGSDSAHPDNLTTSLIFAPCVERETGEEMFLYDTPFTIFRRGNISHVPMLYGYSEMEGLSRIHQFDRLKNEMNANFSRVLPNDIRYLSEARKEEIAKEAKDYYFGSQEITDRNVEDFVRYFTDVHFANPLIRIGWIRRGSYGDTVYMYQYSFADENSILLPNTDLRGAGHCQQFFAVMDEDVTNATEEYKAVKQIMRQLWLDFIETGNPTPNSSALPPWLPLDNYIEPYMVINHTSYVGHSTILEDRKEFWRPLYDGYYMEPRPPSSGVKISLSTSFGLCLLVVNYLLSK